jgi:tRNA modification GTPase
MILTTPDEQTIIACCTPSGNGALALLRLSGKDAWTITSSFSQLGGKKNFLEQKSHTVHFGWIQENHKIIDQVMFIVMRGPKTFTGQDTIEITCHNNPFIIEAIITQALMYGARPAQEGEFSRRAFINGKIDLLQAEAINELISAQTQMALKRNLEHLEGSFSQWIALLEKELLTLFAWCQASFEFLDEEVDFEDKLKESLQHILQKIEFIKKNVNQQHHIKQGIRIALIGSVNAGKSSLFNTLIGQKRAIVTPVAGTTRDSIEAGIYRSGSYITYIDTAGLRKTHDSIEQEGIKRSYNNADAADIILLVIDSERPLTEEEFTSYFSFCHKYSQKVLLVFNKIDLPQIYNQESFNALQQELKIPMAFVSALNNIACDDLEHLIENKIKELLTIGNLPFLLTKRQINLLIGLEQKLLHIHSLLLQTLNYEIIAYHLQEALEHISELTGKTISEASMDAVFKEFCVGK